MRENLPTTYGIWYRSKAAGVWLEWYGHFDDEAVFGRTFSDLKRAEKMARRLSDTPDVERVELRESKTIASYGGIQ